LLISSGERRVQIETGSGIQSILPDAKAVGIIEAEITPRFKQQDFDGGTLAGTKALVNVLQTPRVNAQSQTALPFAPIVPSQGVKPSPIPSQSPVISNSKSTGEDSSNPINGLVSGVLIVAIYGLFLGLFITTLIVSLFIFKIFRSLFSGKSPSPSHRRYSPNNSSSSSGYSSSDYSSSSSSSSDYSSSSSGSDSGGSFGGGDSSGGGGGGGY